MDKLNAKQRRLIMRREKNRHGLSERQFRVYKLKRRQGYSHQSAYIAAL